MSPERLVAVAAERAQCAWVELKTAPEGFEAHVASLGVPDEDIELHGHELYLTFACARGHAGALRVLEREYIGPASRAIARIDRTPAFVDEARQALRERLLVGADPRIGHFAATGSLAAWLRVAALRLALNLKKSGHRDERELLTEAIAEPARSGVADAERYREAVHAALQSAFDALTPRQRNVLRLYYIDGQNIDRIGQLYGAHRASAARWLSAAREQIFEHVSARVRAALGIGESELRSVLHELRSQLEISVMRLVGADREPEARAPGQP